MHRSQTLLRRAAAATAVAAVAAGSLLAVSTAAAADPAVSGPQLTVSQTDGLAAGESVTVQGSGLDPQAGYYVATCVTGTTGPAGPECSGDRAVPGSQLWVSNGRGATTPIAPDGTFTAELNAVAAGTSMSGAPVDCTESDCSITLFYDHRNGFGTVADVPVTFTAAAAAGAVGTEAHASGHSTGGQAAEDAGAQSADDQASATGSDSSSAVVWWTVGGVVVALLVIGGIAVAVRRRGQQGS
ncbi:neocarzinostatin apoprotein domain-containing protein [Tomitella gaofuii]|uniref:neocarzinostatin apoprotein domain-containing protein n=1 Tax=Tomitella gaofuii TaxID=2760083 RepID=UPI0015FDD65B|nr:neocarzinostatin apoprotein domain-containing protein [Tomitella gaofuii]